MQLKEEEASSRRRWKEWKPEEVTAHLDYFLDHIRDEVKGADLRFSLRSSSRRDRRHAIGYLDRILQILNAHNVRLVGRVWIKPVGQPLDPDATYTYAIQDIARHFHAFLDANNETGLLLCDSRMHHQNAQVSHSVFTQKHGLRGDPLPRIPEAPVFGVSLNHAGLQLADAVAKQTPALQGEATRRLRGQPSWVGIR